MKKKIICIILVIFLLVIFILNQPKSNRNSKIEDDLEIKSEELENNLENEKVEVSKKLYKVDIKGAVVNPGVYEVEENSRVIDQTTPIMIQRISGVFERKPLISREI